MREPSGTLEGLSLKFYRVGAVYDVPVTVAAYLVAEGFAVVEMRAEHPEATTIPDRRRKPK